MEDPNSTPDHSPAPEPGDLVLAAYERLPLTEQDWARFERGVNTWSRNLATMLEHAARGVGVGPGWLRPIPEQLTREARRLEGLGDPVWRLWDAYAQEQSLSE